MMVRMRIDLYGLNYDHAKGSEVEVDEATANQWVRARIAEYVVEESEPSSLSSESVRRVSKARE